MIDWKIMNKYMPWWRKRLLSENPLIADIIKIVFLSIVFVCLFILFWNYYSHSAVEMIKPFDLKRPLDNQVAELDALLVRIVKSLQGELLLGKLKLEGIILKEISTPSTPGTNKGVIYLDSTDGSLKVKFDDGDVVTLATY